MSTRPLRVTIAANFPGDEKMGSARPPLRLAAELRTLGADVSLLFSEDLAQVPRGHADQLTAPVRMMRALAVRARAADVVEVAGFDSWLYARFARLRRRGQAVVCRSNGLWSHAVGFERPETRGAGRRLASALYQRHVLCRWERSSIRSAHLSVFPARPDADEVIGNGWAPPEAVAVINHGVDDFFASDVSLDARKDVAFVGTFFHRKGSDIVAAAMSRVLRMRPALGLSLIGPGMPAGDALAQFDADVRGRVSVLDAMPSEQLARRLGGFGVLVFPTRYEGFGLVVVEAMRGGLAVVTTPTGAGADVVRNGENGLIVPIGSVDATATAVERLVDNPALRIRIGAAAAAEASGRTWRRAAEELMVAYERARARAAPA
jgi:glycosyltransferase involved in cell wall biosynthesis